MTRLRVPEAPRKQATVLGHGPDAVPALVVGARGDRGAVMTVFCLAELDGDAVADASLRALTLARGLAAGASTGLAAVVFCPKDLAMAPDLAAYGVGDVFVVSGVDGYAPQAWARVLAELLGGAGSSPDISRHAVIAAGTERGNEVLAHLGAITGLPMAANCVAASAAAGGGLEIVRQRWAGLLLEEAALDATAALLTVATDAVSPEPAPAPRLEVPWCMRSRRR